MLASRAPGDQAFCLADRITSPCASCQEIVEEIRAAYISLRVERAHCERASSNKSYEVSYVQGAGGLAPEIEFAVACQPQFSFR